MIKQLLVIYQLLAGSAKRYNTILEYDICWIRDDLDIVVLWITFAGDGYGDRDIFVLWSPLFF